MRTISHISGYESMIIINVYTISYTDQIKAVIRVRGDLSTSCNRAEPKWYPNWIECGGGGKMDHDPPIEMRIFWCPKKKRKKKGPWREGENGYAVMGVKSTVKPGLTRDGNTGSRDGEARRGNCPGRRGGRVKRARREAHALCAMYEYIVNGLLS